MRIDPHNDCTTIIPSNSRERKALKELANEEEYRWNPHDEQLEALEPLYVATNDTYQLVRMIGGEAPEELR